MNEKQIQEIRDKYPDSKIKMSFGGVDEPRPLSTGQDEYLSESEVFELAGNLIDNAGLSISQVIQILKDNGNKAVSKTAIYKIKQADKAMIKLALKICELLYPANVEFAEERYFLFVGLDSPNHSMNK